MNDEANAYRFAPHLQICKEKDTELRDENSEEIDERMKVTWS